MANLIGSDASQISTNGMLGTAAFVDEANLVKNNGTQPPVSIAVNSTSPALTITQDGTGNALEVRDVTGDTTPFVVDASGSVGIGVSPAARLHTGVADASTSIGSSAAKMVVQNLSGAGLNQTAGVEFNISSNTASGINRVAGVYGVYEVYNASGLGGALVLATNTPGGTSVSERMRITSAGLITANNSTGLGYGTGSGGTVTQATSKSTAVTLNKPSGQITMHNAALAAGASVVFTVNNTTLVATDTVVVTKLWDGIDPIQYRVECSAVAANGFQVRVTNITGSSLSDALVLNFTVIKGSIS